MALVTRQNNQKDDMAEQDMARPSGSPDDQPGRADEPSSPPASIPAARGRRAPENRPSAARSAGGHFYTIYKSGQGYWTRMCTAGGILMVSAFTSQFTFGQILVPWPLPRGISFGVSLGIFLVMLLLGLWYMNRPASADFLIATDSEMKKVNWTSRQELIGATKVVILFVVVIALALFVIDFVFSSLFFRMGVLKFGYSF